ncbi:precorrin-6A reductase [Brevibacillus daliensis]|uniref:precorrin-6A reductase n=1 Tax=Brevibacillus daliensis TaxID=2892995 RepID=UPI001E54ABAF|nr:precorrin-6A reductase [Brevibacillus daliensis]
MILFMAGTSDARELAVLVKEAGYQLVTTVVTDSAAKSLQDIQIPVNVGRLSLHEMVEFAKELKVTTIVDATHPFAEEASTNAMACAKQLEVPYIRFEREMRSYIDNPSVLFVKDYEQAALEAKKRKGTVMLTTGSKTLATFTKHLLGDPDIRLIARMLPRLDNMEKCQELGVEQKNIVAIQGPFSKELNMALFRQFEVDIMVTKESGKVGSVDEKLEAALELGLFTIVIDRPKLVYGAMFQTFNGILHELDRLEHKN